MKRIIKVAMFLYSARMVIFECYRVIRDEKARHRKIEDEQR